MRIAQVSPLHESVPPRLYGGTERIVSYLTEALVRLGHDVTLFASGDSRTEAQLAAGCARGLRLDRCPDTAIPHLVMFERVCERQHEFDLVHFHTEALHFPGTRRLHVPQLTTFHGRLDLPCMAELLAIYNDLPLASISHSQRMPHASANWVGTVHHGLPRSLYRCCDQPDDYLVFIGRIAREKRPDLAIEIARRSGLRLKIAAKVSISDQPYFDQRIAPLLDSPQIEWVGEVTDHQKQDLIGKAAAMLFPIDWPEPFGLAMIEAMACGTPVIAFPRGAVPEVIDHGVSGLLVQDVDGAIAAVAKARAMNRHEVRACFERRFRASRMARDYVRVYQSLREGRSARSVAASNGAVHA